MTNQIPSFPFSLLNHDQMPGEIGELLSRVHQYAIRPPYAWGQWLYARVFRERCAELRGDLIELGVGRGATSLFFALMTRGSGKRVYSLDSFEGLPDPDPKRDNPYFLKRCYESDSRIAKNLFERFQDAIGEMKLDEQVIPLKGFFSQTVKQLPTGQKFCLAHLDSDLYASVYDSLDGIYDRMVEGGMIIVDDFFHHAQGPLRATVDFLNSRRIFPVFHVSFPYSVFFFKGENKGAAWPRSLDGNTYSFEWLRHDEYFRTLLSDQLNAMNAIIVEKGIGAGPYLRSYENGLRLRKLVESTTSESSDIYEYWRSMEDYWDKINFTPRTEGPWIRL